MSLTISPTYLLSLTPVSGGGTGSERARERVRGVGWGKRRPEARRTGEGVRGRERGRRGKEGLGRGGDEGGEPI